MSEERNQDQPFSPYNVLAAYPDLDTTREALGDVEKAGIEGGRISLLGPSVEESMEEMDTSERDSEAVGHVGKRVGAGAAAGGAAGGGVGLLAGLAAFAIPGVGPVIGAGVIASALGGALAGSAVGGFVGGIASLRGSQAWELTLGSVREGRTVLVVHAADEAEASKALEAVRGTDPHSVEVFDQEDGTVQLEDSSG